ncbi:hypothetical protein HII36_54290 [Nonomuraea sp. NN258]|uniref:hypothetical protein n=1 Tax=Nonomuraea antri TaxID=2730852 RepID=UPI001568E5AC|nr:hypothetical protein [Nonomuraea antri]NRQ40722.1 hypothetical protein [Nonomuraea antri]
MTRGGTTRRPSPLIASAPIRARKTGAAPARSPAVCSPAAKSHVSGFRAAGSCVSRCPDAGYPAARFPVSRSHVLIRPRPSCHSPLTATARPATTPVTSACARAFVAIEGPN